MSFLAAYFAKIRVIRDKMNTEQSMLLQLLTSEENAFIFGVMLTSLFGGEKVRR